MWAASSRRQYLLKTKAKYAGMYDAFYRPKMCHVHFVEGQKIAKKLSLQISKETKKIRELLPEFNACRSVSSECAPLEMEEALDPTTLTTIVDTSVSHSKREFIDTFLRIRRSDEEIAMLTMEMNCTVAHYEHEVQAVLNCIESYTQKRDAFSRGAIALLRSLLCKHQVRLSESHHLHSIMKSSGSVPSTAAVLTSYSDSEEESSSDESMI